jgi:large subunit ribosomal protein L24
VPARIRKGDRVVLLSGKDKGKSGIVMEVRPSEQRVLEVRPSEQRVLVEGVNMMKRHTKPRPPNEPGGVIERPAPVHLSNVALIDPKDQRPTRVRIQEIDGKRVRVSARSGEKLD